jgi:peroxiredoxin
MPLLNPGDQFPRLTITTTGDQTLTFPDAFAGDFGVVLLYRGSWCPYCNAQLGAFERAGHTLADNGIRVAALSVDDKETTGALVERHMLRLPRVAARARAEHGRAAVGPFYEAVSSEIFDAPGAAGLTPAARGSRAFAEPLLTRVGLPAGLGGRAR